MARAPRWRPLGLIRLSSGPLPPETIPKAAAERRGGGGRRRVPSICVSLPVAATILAYGRLVLLLARLTVSPSISALDLSTYKTRKKW